MDDGKTFAGTSESNESQQANAWRENLDREKRRRGAVEGEEKEEEKEGKCQAVLQDV